MPIPDDRLESWTRQGSIVASKATHEAVRKALSASSDLSGRDYEIYLQGSYRNSTNIRGDSDVDIVAQINDVFYSNKKSLPGTQLESHRKSYGAATYRLEQFREHVIEALRSHFGSNSITEGNKAIKVAGSSNRLPADVVTCAQYRHYHHFHSVWDYRMVEGITFFTKHGRQIINYPKPHYDNGVLKNRACISHYKAGVRMFKNARNEAVSRGLLSLEDVPSYFLECFAYNAHNNCYLWSWKDVYQSVLRNLKDGNYSEYLCQNEVIRLFGTGDDQWNAVSADKLIAALGILWTIW